MKIIADDLLRAESGFVCHGVNCCGKMGKGIALAVRQKYPKAYHQYLDLWMTYGSVTGDDRLLGIAQFVSVGPQLWIVNCHNQVFYGNHEIVKGCPTGHFSYQAFDQCFDQVTLLAHSTGLPVHVPKIGCNLAGAEWGKVSDIIETYAHRAEIVHWAGEA